MIPGWTYYNHALLPTTPPHEEPNIKILELEKGKVWNLKRDILLVRYTEDFDCGYETQWWWLIKDDPMDISKLNTKKRYKITTGLKNFVVKKISPEEYAEQILSVYIEAFNNYQNAGRAQSKEEFIKQCINDNTNTQIDYYGAFYKDNGELAGYSLNHVFDDHVELWTSKFAPKYLSKQVSAALVYTMLCDYLNVQKKKYVNDGERSIRHVTNFQSYLIELFGFRKAYCKLRVEYRPFVGSVIKLLFPFRKPIRKIAKNSVLNNVSSLLEMEAIRKSFETEVRT